MISVEDTKETALGDGTTVAFSFGFKVDEDTDLIVLLVAADGVETPLTLDTDYTVVLNNDQSSNPGGFITMTTAPDSGLSIVIMRGMDFVRGETFTSSVPPHIIEFELDRLTMYAQVLREKLDRALHVGPGFQSDPVVGLGNAATRAAKVVGFDDAGNAALYSFAGGSLVGPAGAMLASRVEFDAPAIFRQSSDGSWSHTSVTATFIWSSAGVTVESREVEVTIDDVTGEFDDPGLAEPGDEFTSELVGTHLLNITSEYNGQREYAQFAIAAMPSDEVFDSDTFTPAWGTAGFSTDPVGAVSYANHVGLVTLYVDAALVAESDNAAMTWDAGSIPASIRPADTRIAPCVLQYDDSTEVQGQMTINADGSATFNVHTVVGTRVELDGTFQTGEDKGLPATWSVIYPL